jgi:ATP-dependent RNA helicase DBP3
VRTFVEAGFPPNVLAACSGFKQPSPIQAQCWPIVLRGRDLIGIAATGSGKTLAFILPALVHIAAQRPATPNEPILLVLAPTRELAMQTAEVAEKAGASCDVRSACVYGGAPKGPQYAALRGKAQVVVATPGRLQDLLQEGALSLARATFLVLDEADRMLDLGFEPAIRAIAGAIRSDRQTLMFSATWPNSIQLLAREFLSAPVVVRIGGEGTRASASITQTVEVIDSDARDNRLEQLLMQVQGDKASKRRCIIFVLYKKEATRVSEWLRRRGWNAREIQGDMPQKQRTEAVAAFKSGSLPLLIATDVAARGLDIPGVESVIKCDQKTLSLCATHCVSATATPSRLPSRTTCTASVCARPAASARLR